MTSFLPARLSSLPLLGIVLLVLLLPGCDLGIPGSGDEATIEDETFVEVMVELRRETLAAGGTLPEEERDRILEAHGVTSDDLVDYARVHGGNVPRMHEVWTRIEEELGRGGRMEEAPREQPETPPLEPGSP